jgi:hypothetical protein
MTQVGAALVLLVTTPLKADVVDVVWSATGEFEHTANIAPHKLAELCVALRKGERVQWRFEAAAPLDFNVHFHVGRDVIYPIKHNAIAQAEGVLVAVQAQNYCWMWTNKTEQGSQLSVKLRKQN